MAERDEVSGRRYAIRVANLGLLAERSLARVLARYDLSPMEHRVLLLLVERGPSSATDLAPFVHIDASFISRTVQHLYDKGLVTRRRSLSDRRIVTLRVSSAGQELASAASESVQELDKELTRWIPDDRLSEFSMMLDEMNRSLRSVSGQDEPRPSIDRGG